VAAIAAAAIAALGGTIAYISQRTVSPPTAGKHMGAVETEPVWTIAVIPSGFSTVPEFKNVLRPFRDAILKNDRFFAAHPQQIRFVETNWTVRLPDLLRESNDPCYFKRDEALGAQVGRAIEGSHIAGLTSLLVLNNKDENYACTAGELVVADQTSYEVAAHEFGHLLGGLYDEREGDRIRPAHVKGPNCASDPGNPPWDRASIGEPLPGCWLNAQLWRPSDNCRMRNPQVLDFCQVCNQHLSEVFSSTAPSAEAPRPDYTQFVIQVWPTAGTKPRTISWNTFDQPVPSQVLRGNIVAGALIDDQVCLGPSYSDVFTTRWYRGQEETPASRMGSTADDSIFIVVNCPGKIPRDRFTTLEFVPATAGASTWITPSIFRAGHASNEKRIFSIQ
jgi:hypothetical protein